MKRAITLYFLTPYLCSITRDQDFVHSPLPLDGALAHAAYWRALVAGQVSDSPTDGKADLDIMAHHVTPVLDNVLERIELGDKDLLDDASIDEWVYAISSGFPVLDGRIYIKRGAGWFYPKDSQREPLTPEQEVQPIRKRVDITRLSSLELTRVGKRGRPRTSEPETGKGALKAIDNRLVTWQVYEYVWLADIKDEMLLRELLEVLKFQKGLGKKRSAGFGKLLDYDIKPLDTLNLGFPIERKLFVNWNNDLVLLRPLPYDTVMLAPQRIVMTNLVVESGCGYQPPYWSNRRVVVREGTIFRFLD